MVRLDLRIMSFDDRTQPVDGVRQLGHAAFNALEYFVGDLAPVLPDVLLQDLFKLDQLLGLEIIQLQAQSLVVGYEAGEPDLEAEQYDRRDHATADCSAYGIADNLLHQANPPWIVEGKALSGAALLEGMPQKRRWQHGKMPERAKDKELLKGPWNPLIFRRFQIQTQEDSMSEKQNELAVQIAREITLEAIRSGHIKPAVQAYETTGTRYGELFKGVYLSVKQTLEDDLKQGNSGVNIVIPPPK